MNTIQNISPAKIKAAFQEHWIRFEYWFRRRWLGLLALAVLAYVFTHRDISVQFSMQKGEGGLFTTKTETLFYDPFEGDVALAQNVSLTQKKDLSGLTPQQLAKRRRQLAYVKQYAPLAIKEMSTHHVPASITLAQGLLESNVGQSRLATENKNHFGIKCFSKSCKKGHCSNFSDDHHKDFFRAFASVQESFAAHSKLLQKDRYRKLFQLPIKDYKGWAVGLKKAGYATDPRYGPKLIRIIEDLDLYQYDY